MAEEVGVCVVVLGRECDRVDEDVGCVLRVDVCLLSVAVDGRELDCVAAVVEEGVILSVLGRLPVDDCTAVVEAVCDGDVSRLREELMLTVTLRVVHTAPVHPSLQSHV